MSRVINAGYKIGKYFAIAAVLTNLSSLGLQTYLSAQIANNDFAKNAPQDAWFDAPWDNDTRPVFVPFELQRTCKATAPRHGIYIFAGLTGVGAVVGQIIAEQLQKYKIVTPKFADPIAYRAGVKMHTIAP